MTASEKAKKSQYEADNYPGVDNWQDSPLHKGNIIYVWEGEDQTCHNQDGACAMTPDTAFACDGDPEKLRNSVQTDLNPKYDTHRGVLRAYEINGDVDAAFSHCEANTCHGEGGGEQYYIPDFDSLQEQGLISHRDDLDLHFDKDRLAVTEDEKAQDAANVKDQIEETPNLQSEDGTINPSEGSTPTLQGAYTGETEGLGDTLQPKVDETNQEWAGNQQNNQVDPKSYFKPAEFEQEDELEKQPKSEEQSLNTEISNKPELDDRSNNNQNSPDSNESEKDDDYYYGMGM